MTIVRCPTCKQSVEPGARFRPFCCERCKLIDLGRWLDGSYAIPGEPASDEELSEDLLSQDLQDQHAPEDPTGGGKTRSRHRN